MITVNCRGTHVTAAKTTLESMGYFSGMMDLDDSSMVWLDVDPAHFHRILDSIVHHAVIRDPAMINVCRYVCPAAWSSHVLLRPDPADLTLAEFIDLIEYQAAVPPLMAAAVANAVWFTTIPTQLSSVAFEYLARTIPNVKASFILRMIEESGGRESAWERLIDHSNVEMAKNTTQTMERLCRTFTRLVPDEIAKLDWSIADLHDRFTTYAHHVFCKNAPDGDYKTLVERLPTLIGNLRAVGNRRANLRIRDEV
jgi:hypothetical protein